RDDRVDAARERLSDVAVEAAADQLEVAEERSGVAPAGLPALCVVCALEECEVLLAALDERRGEAAEPSAPHLGQGVDLADRRVLVAMAVLAEELDVALVALGGVVARLQPAPRLQDAFDALVQRQPAGLLHVPERRGRQRRHTGGRVPGPSGGGREL